MSVNGIPANVVEAPIQASAPTAIKPGTKAAPSPLFDDIAAHTPTPFPSLAGC